MPYHTFAYSLEKGYADTLIEYFSEERRLKQESSSYRKEIGHLYRLCGIDAWHNSIEYTYEKDYWLITLESKDLEKVFLRLQYFLAVKSASLMRFNEVLQKTAKKNVLISDDHPKVQHIAMLGYQESFDFVQGFVLPLDAQQVEKCSSFFNALKEEQINPWSKTIPFLQAYLQRNGKEQWLILQGESHTPMQIENMITPILKESWASQTSGHLSFASTPSTAKVHSR